MSSHESNPPKPYAKFRFEWKHAVLGNPIIDRGAKQVAVILADSYVNKATGMCWPKNQTLADVLCYSVRTVQRHLRTLEELGFLKRTRTRGARRAYLIELPRNEHDTVHDKLPSGDVTSCDAESDARVIPHKNQGKKHRNSARVSNRTLKYHLIDQNDYSSVGAWKVWIANNRGLGPDQLLSLLRENTAYRLPARFPETQSDTYNHAFFDNEEAKHRSDTRK